MKVAFSSHRRISSALALGCALAAFLACPVAQTLAQSAGRTADFPSPNAGGQSPTPVRKGSSLSNAAIIEAFTTKESEFRKALENYVYRQEIKMQTLGFNDRPDGEYYRLSEVTFTESGQRKEVIKRFPQPTLRTLNITQSDLQDFGVTNPFPLTKEELSNYQIEFLKKEKLDEIDAYVFEVRPKVVPKFKEGSKRYFTGRIWVDDQDLQIVKTEGRTLPEDDNNKFPRFQSYRENIDGKYWFPTYIYVDDTLNFKNGSIHIRMEIRYMSYKQFQTDIKIID